MALTHLPFFEFLLYVRHITKRVFTPWYVQCEPELQHCVCNCPLDISMWIHFTHTSNWTCPERTCDCIFLLTAPGIFPHLSNWKFHPLCCSSHNFMYSLGLSQTPHLNFWNSVSTTFKIHPESKNYSHLHWYHQNPSCSLWLSIYISVPPRDSGSSLRAGLYPQNLRPSKVHIMHWPLKPKLKTWTKPILKNSPLKAVRVKISKKTEQGLFFKIVGVNSSEKHQKPISQQCATLQVRKFNFRKNKAGMDWELNEWFEHRIFHCRVQRKQGTGSRV